MGKVSNKVSKGLGAAIAEAQAKINGSSTEEQAVEALLNSGAEAQKKRKRRTKAEMEAARQAESGESNSLFESLEIPEEESKPKTHDEFCELEIRKAHDRCLPEPDFDFRAHYEKGTIIYFVRVLEALGEKEVKKLHLRTIYPRLMVGSQEKGCCYCIGYNERDRVFLTPRDADAYFKTVNVTAKYTSEEPKSRRKTSEGIDEEVDTENSLEEAYTSSEEVEDDG